MTPLFVLELRNLDLQQSQGLDLRHRATRKAFGLRRHMVLVLSLRLAESGAWYVHGSCRKRRSPPGLKLLQNR